MSNDILIVKPFLKWVGGKTQIINTIINEYPTEMENYHDIFLGGGSTLFALLSYVKNDKIKVKNNIYAYDINKDLINVYKNIQSNPLLIWKKIKIYIKEYLECDIEGSVNRKPKNLKEAKSSRESYYYWIRSNYNITDDDIIKSSMFIFLNKTGFRGLYRTSSNGYNVPYGHYSNPSIIDKETILNISDLIKDVIFKVKGFEKSILKIEKGDFAYLDPPYAPESSKSFVGYNADGFKIEQHEKLFEMCNQLKKEKIMFMMSNSNTDLVISAFNKKKYSIETIECRRNINSKKPNSKTMEIIIKSF